MKKNTVGKYVVCPKTKGLQKKHIAICEKCNIRKNCHPYQEYFQAYIKD